MGSKSPKSDRKGAANARTFIGAAPWSLLRTLFVPDDKTSCRSVMSFDEVVVPEVVVPDVVVADVVVPEVVGPAVAVIIPTGVAAVVVGCNAPVTAGAISIGAGGFNPSCWLNERAAGGGVAAPPRTKFHEQATVVAVPGGAGPGAMLTLIARGVAASAMTVFVATS